VSAIGRRGFVTCTSTIPSLTSHVRQRTRASRPTGDPEDESGNPSEIAINKEKHAMSTVATPTIEQGMEMLMRLTDALEDSRPENGGCVRFQDGVGS
jgi:hypothetical protein